MARLREVGVVAVAVLGMGGTLFAGYLLGRGSALAPPPRHAASAPSEDEGETEGEAEDDAADVAPVQSSRRPTPSAAVVDGRRPTVRGPDEAPPAGALLESGVLLEERTTVYESADAKAPVVRILPPGTYVEVVQSIAGWRHVGWTKDASAFGWVLRSENRPPNRGGLAAGPQRGRIEGFASLVGEPPRNVVPRKRRDAEFCKLSQVPSGVVIRRNGRLQDVLVRLAPRSVPGVFATPKEHVVVDQWQCNYTPRIQGAMVKQVLDIRNSDGTVHNAHLFQGLETWFNEAQPKRAPPIERTLPPHAEIVKLTCDVHPWMRAFVVVTDHPFFAVTAEDGTFSLEGVPVGSWVVEAWHSHYGSKVKTAVRVQEGRGTNVEVTYRGDDPEPPENKDELEGL